MGAEQAKNITQSAISRGNQLHHWVEQWARGLEEPPLTPEVAPFVRSVEPVLREISSTVLVEAAVMHHDLRYGEQLPTTGTDAWSYSGDR